MRIRSLHPSYLDSKWLVALWRETLLAKHVLEWKTKWYKNHPQLDRFKSQSDPLSAINQYLSVVEQEASQRWYHFDKTKIWPIHDHIMIPVTDGQMKYEFDRFCSKVASRSPNDYTRIRDIKTIIPHPLFTVISGDMESWERIQTNI